MTYILSKKEIIDAENVVINSGVPALILMERAGQAAYNYLAARFDKSKRFLAVCGGGKNGGDGAVIARLLYENGYKVDLYCPAPTRSYECEVKLIKFFGNKVENMNGNYDVVIDALLGTGLNKPVDGKYLDIIGKINEKRCFTVSVDIASGLDADSGKVLGDAVAADLTLALGAYKYGHFFNDGIDVSGTVVPLDIGLSAKGALVLASDELVKGSVYLPRPRNCNKGDFGRSTLIAGSRDFLGGSMIAAAGLTALRAGAGYAELLVPKSLYNLYAAKEMEVTISRFKDADGDMLFDKGAMDKAAKKSASIAFGMGLRTTEEVYKSLNYLLDNFNNGTLIIDADGINSLAAYGIDALKSRKMNGRVVLTPHVAEFARLLNIGVGDVEKNGVELSRRFAEEYDVTIVLKSSVTVVADRNSAYLVTSGSPSMAKAGSGDILSGVLCGISAFDRSIEAIAAGAYLFGKAGELAKKEHSDWTATARDIIACVPKAIEAIING